MMGISYSVLRSRAERQPSAMRKAPPMTSVLLVVSGSDHWTLKDGTKHPTGFWASEFIHPHQVFTEAGYDITVATPGGVTPTLDEISLCVDLNGGDQATVDAQRKYLEDLGEILTRP